MPDEPSGTVAVAELEWLERAVSHYHQRLLETPSAQDYLLARGVTATEMATAFRLGYADGTLKELLPPEGRYALHKVGVLNPTGRETLHDCITFPLVAPHNNTVVDLYGRHTKHQRHIYPPGARRGIFNPQGARNTEEVVITSSVFDAALVWSAGLRNVIPTYGVRGLTDEIVAYLEECRVRSAAILVSSDKTQTGIAEIRAAAEEVAARLTQVNINARLVNIPARNLSAFISANGSAEELRLHIQPESERKRSRKTHTQPVPTLAAAMPSVSTPPSTSMQPSVPQSVPAQPTPVQVVSNPPEDSETEPEGINQPEVESAPDGVLIIVINNREYRIKGLSPVGLDRLRINLRVRFENSFHLDTIDLYQARARTNFAEAAAKICDATEQEIGRDLLHITERLEAVRLMMRRTGAENRKMPMSDPEQEAAMDFLRDPKLTERIVADFRQCGLVGERATVLTAYLGAISRKLAEPMGLLIVARSGAGKSALQDALHAFVPPEDSVRVTRLTGQALFYKDPNSLQRKMLVIAEEEGAAQAVYSLRTLASDQRLAIAATRTDPQTGKLQTEHYEVYGPVVIVITTTSAEAFDEETRSRFVQLTMDESVEQTRMVLERQRQRYTLQGVLERKESDTIRRLHHNAQRLLRPLEIVNPYVNDLSYPAERLIHRREQKKYLTLINAIALLHQHQREIKRVAKGDIEIEYVEVSIDDIKLANELATIVLSGSLDELSPPVRGMYREIRRLCEKRAKETGISLREVQLSRREIREAIGWSDWQVRTYCQQLVEMEYLYASSGSNGKRYVYEIVRTGKEDDDNSALRGLVDAGTLRRRV